MDKTRLFIGNVETEGDDIVGFSSTSLSALLRLRLLVTKTNIYPSQGIKQDFEALGIGYLQV